MESSAKKICRSRAFESNYHPATGAELSAGYGIACCSRVACFATAGRSRKGRGNMQSQPSPSIIPPPLPLAREQHTFVVSCKSTDISGKGRVILDGDTLSLESRRLFRIRKSRTDLPLSSIVNVVQDDKDVRFEIRTTDDSGQEVIRFFTLSLKSASKAENLTLLLPDTVTADGDRLTAEGLAFSTMLHSTTRFAFVTPTLILINIAVFLLMVIAGADLVSPESEQLVTFGANYAPLTLSGQWWRVLSCAFIHFGIIHLGFNMWVLHGIGSIVERLYGNLHFILVYLSAGIFASMASLVWNSETAVSAGASGAIFGIYGALAAILIKHRNLIPPLILKTIKSSTFSFIVYNLGFGLMIPFIDNAAHVGGLMSGFMIGFVAARPMEPTARRKFFWLRLIFISISVGLLAVGTLFALPRHYGQVDRFLQLYTETESLAIASHESLFVLLENTQLDDESFINQVELQVLPKWQLLVNQGSAIEVPSDSSAANLLTYLIEIATLRRDALVALIDGMRTNNPEQLEQSGRFHAKANELIESSRSAATSSLTP